MIVRKTVDIVKNLTVRPQSTQEYPNPPAFKVFLKNSKDTIVVPRFYAPKDALGRHHTDSSAVANITFKGSLREETKQPEAVQRALDAFHTKGGGILCLPPGWGKTTVALAIASEVKLKTAIIVHKEFLANQWRERIRQFCPGSTIGLVQQSKFEADADFVIVMLQTLSQRDWPKDTFSKVGFMIVDECHHIGSRVFSQGMFQLTPRYALGLSGTPDRKDGLTRVLTWFLGDIFLSVERKGAKGVVVKRIDYSCPRYKQAPPTLWNGKLSLAEMITEVTEDIKRTALIVEIAREAESRGRKVLILSDRRDHCEEFARKTGGSLYMGGMKEAELEKSAKASTIIGTFSMAQEGLDIPSLDTLILATPKSDVRQAVGRILRGGSSGGGIHDPIIYDVVDSWSILFAMAVKRVSVYRKCGFCIEGDAPPQEAKMTVPREPMFI